MDRGRAGLTEGDLRRSVVIVLHHRAGHVARLAARYEHAVQGGDDSLEAADGHLKAARDLALDVPSGPERYRDGLAHARRGGQTQPGAREGAIRRK